MTSNPQIERPRRSPRTSIAMFGLGRFIRYVPFRTRTAFYGATFRCHGNKTVSGTKRREHPQPGRSVTLACAPLNDQSFEIVAGARRYRAAKIAEAPTVPVRIVHFTDAEALEAQLIELSIVGKSFLCLYAIWHVVYM